MKIESVNVTVFQYPTRRVSDSAGHSHPGVESMAKMAMLTFGKWRRSIALLSDMTIGVSPPDAHARRHSEARCPVNLRHV